MPTPPLRASHDAVLEALFQRHTVVVLDQMRDALGASRRTVCRVLQRLGYLTSYNHAGQYYTRPHLPQFAADGLWSHGPARFSAQGTLRATVAWWVQHAPAGHTDAELAARLGLRVRDTLRSLVAARVLGREVVAAVGVYVAGTPAVAAAQVAQRRDQMGGVAAGAPPPALAVVAPAVEVLRTLLRHPGDAPSALAARLQGQGLAVSGAQVAAIVARYGLGEKTPPSGSPRSPRYARPSAS